MYAVEESVTQGLPREKYYLGNFGKQSIPSILIKKNLAINFFSNFSLTPLLLDK